MKYFIIALVLMASIGSVAVVANTEIHTGTDTQSVLDCLLCH